MKNIIRTLTEIGKSNSAICIVAPVKLIQFPTALVVENVISYSPETVLRVDVIHKKNVDISHKKKKSTKKCSGNCENCTCCSSSQKEISESFSEKIFWKNYDILLKKYNQKAISWEERLFFLNKLIEIITDLATIESPEQKVYAAFLKKLIRSFTDSFFDYSQYLFMNSVNENMIPKAPLFEADEKSIFLKQEREEKKRTYANRHKKDTMYKKRARKNKLAEQEFWMKQWEIYEENETEAQEQSYDYEVEIEKALQKVIDAEKGLLLPCIEKAAWAIHDNKVAEFADSVIDAEMLYEQYLKAVEDYENLLFLASKDAK